MEKKSVSMKLKTRLVSTLGQRLGLLRRAMTLGVRALVLDCDNRVFLVRHTYTPGWYLPGGGVEKGESAEAALARELEEEGAIILTGRPVLSGFYFNQRGHGRDHVALYSVCAFTQVAPKIPDHEIADSGFFTLKDLPAATTAATRARLAEMLEGAPKSPFW